MPKTSRAASRQPMPAPVALERLADTVFIEGLVLHTVIGIDADELHQAQPLVVDLEMDAGHLDAGRTDRIADAIDYGAVRLRLIELATSHRVKLLEAFAELIAETLIHGFGAGRVRVRVAKPRKFGDVAALGVTIERRRPGPFGRRALGLVE